MVYELGTPRTTHQTAVSQFVPIPTGNSMLIKGPWIYFLKTTSIKKSEIKVDSEWKSFQEASFQGDKKSPGHMEVL